MSMIILQRTFFHRTNVHYMLISSARHLEIMAIGSFKRSLVTMTSFKVWSHLMPLCPQCESSLHVMLHHPRSR